MNPYIGQLLDDRYELLEVIGTGGMAVVYKALCHRLNRLVAVKILKDEYSGDSEFRRRFRAEGEAVAMLSHPNIVQVFDVSSADNAYFIVMELIDGISLKQYMEAKGILNWKETLHFASQIAKGLEHAHSRGIVHRDIKPHNVMVLKNGSVKVMDFGIAQVMNKASTLTKEALGSVHYISPEQAKGSFTDNRSDIYSLGVVMYEMMAGRPPYDGESPVAVAIQHINGGAPMPSTFNPNIPAGIEKIIMKCMSLDAANRYATATELLQDLEEFRKNPVVTHHEHPHPENGEKKPEPKPEKQDLPTKKIGTNGKYARQNGVGQLRTKTPPKPPVPPKDPQEALRIRRQKREEERLKEERGRIATAAIAVCSIVAVAAIVVFLWAIFNGALIRQERELVEVPILIGEMYSDDLEIRYPDFKLRLQPQRYDPNYSKGMIMKQEPAGGEKVSKGTEIYITVSMGEEPAVKVMLDLTDVTLEQAESFLMGQGFQPLIREEASSTVKENHVIRTEPGPNTELTEGQVVELWISTGPDVELAKMPEVLGMDKENALILLDKMNFRNVTTIAVKSERPLGEVVRQSVPKGEQIDVTTLIYLEVSEGPQIPTAKMPDVLGMDQETAKALLTQLGFTNVVCREVENTKPKGQVIAQSHYRQTVLELSTEITLDISSGPKETEPTQPAERTLSVQFQVPERSEAYDLSIFQNGRPVVTNARIQPGENSYTVTLTGKGTVEYELFINGDYVQTSKVDFGNGN